MNIHPFLFFAAVLAALFAFPHGIQGSQWAALGVGLDGGVNAIVRGGDGTVFYVGGQFAKAGGGKILNYVAKWDGSSWSNVGAGLAGGTKVYALAVDAKGNLYAGGDFTTAGAVTANRIAKWFEVAATWLRRGQ